MAATGPRRARGPAAAAAFVVLALGSLGGGTGEEVPPADVSAQYRALGLTPGAASLEVQLAYTRLTSQYKPETKLGSDARRQFVEVQQAFQALSDEGARADSLATVSYFDHVRRLSDDDELQHFTEFRPGGSAHLRIIFFLESGSERHWDVWRAATQLNGNALVAQIGHKDARNMNGEQGPFMQSFRLFQYPSAVIYDPISRAVKVSHSLDGVAAMAQRFLSGELSSGDKLARVQELDEESFRWRCGHGEEGSTVGCDFAFVLATTNSQEEKLDELSATLRNFVDASKMLHNVPEDMGKNIACFWLRVDRSPTWDPFLRQQGMSALDSVAHMALAWQPMPMAIVAPPHLAHGSTIGLQGWFRKVVGGTEQPSKPVVGKLPPLPPPASPSEDPGESFVTRMTRMAKSYTADIAPEIERLTKWAETELKKTDTEEKVMIFGAAICALWLLIFLMRRFCCCCGRRNTAVSEDDLLATVAAVVEVPLQRQQGEKLGMGIGPATGDVFTITSIAPGELVDRWNSAQPEAHRRIREGDRIVGVVAAGGAGDRATNCSTMGEAMRVGGDLTLYVAMARAAKEPQVQAKTASYVMLKDLKSLRGAVQLRPPQLSWAGIEAASCMEVANVGPELAEWSSKRAGGCAMQRLEVGDLIVAVNGSTSVATQLDAPNPLILVVRWRPPGALRAERFETAIQRSGPEDKLGMHIRNVPGTAHIEAVEVFEEGAIARAGQGGGTAVMAGDRFVAVNGVTTVEGMKQEMGKLSLSLTVERWVQDAHVGAGPAGAGPPEPQKLPPKQPMMAQAAAPPVAASSSASAAPRASSGTGGGGGDPASGKAMDSCLCLLFLVALVALIVASVDGTIPSADQLPKYILGDVPYNDDSYCHVGLGFLGFSGLFGLRFWWYEISMVWRPAERRLFSQLVVAACSSVCMGYGAFFLFTWAGVYDEVN